MSQAVDRILAQRSRRDSRRPEAVSLTVAALLHAGAVALALLLPRLTPPPPPMSFVPVQIIPAAALGVRRPASRPKAEKPTPPAPEPTPEAEPPKPEPEKIAAKPQDDVPVLPEKTPKKPEKTPPPASTPASPSTKPGTKPPEKPPVKPPTTGGTGTNPAGTAAQGTPEGEAGRRGSPTGNPVGTSSFGSEIAGLDNPDFKFGYYIDQLLASIDAKWMRPPLGDNVRCIISFRIQRDGSITDLTVGESSGYNSFDLAALRAVQNASPFAPLPRAYRNDSLGVNLIVR
ncbi:MAG: periplasmic protein TonB [Acidobacteriota bacterium]|nr:periplasmic protein TonB [Acidobacteriota bacterium]